MRSHGCPIFSLCAAVWPLAAARRRSAASPSLISSSTPSSSKHSPLRLLLAVVLLLLQAVPATAQLARNPDNGHHYELVSVPLSWDAARAAAESRTLAGVRGHLVTITSPTENGFIVAAFGALLGSSPWIGGFQPAGSPEPAGNWQWVTGEPFSYTNWDSGQPSNSGSENTLQILAGGRWNDSNSGNTISYIVEYDTDPTLQSPWKTLAPMPTRRYGLAAVTAPNGNVYAIGGEPGTGSPLRVVEAYDPVANAWATVASLPTPRANLAATLGLDGRIYAIGGYRSDIRADTNAVEAYDPSTNTWTQLDPLPTAREVLAAVTGADGKIYAIGGYIQSGGAVNTVEVYDPSTNTWMAKAPMPTRRYGIAAVRGAGGLIYVIGGVTQEGILSPAVEVYDPGTNTWSTRASMPTPRYGLAAAIGLDGRIYAFGGNNAAANRQNVLNSAEAYSSSGNTWAGLFPMPTARNSLAAATGHDGTIYAIGGWNNVTLSTVEAYTPPAGPSSELFVASYGSKEVKRYNGLTGAFIDTFVSTDTPGEFRRPNGITFGPDGNLYVGSAGGDAPSWVNRYSGLTGAFLDAFVPTGTGGLFGASGIAFGPDGDLYVSSYVNARVLRYSGTTGSFKGVLANLGGPQGLTFGPDGNLYVNSESGVYRFNGTTGESMGRFVPNDRGEALLGLTFGPDSNLYVSVYYASEVRRYNGTTGAYIDTPIPAGSGGLRNPSGIAFGPDGNLYVSSTGTHEIKRYNGTTGAFISNFVPVGSGGLSTPAYLVFRTPTACAPPPSGLVSWWPADGDALDRIGANHGTLRNAVTFATGKVSQAFSLNGINNFVQVPDNASLRPAQFTWETWVYPSSLRLGSWDTVVSHGASGNSSLGCCGDTLFLGFYGGRPFYETFHASGDHWLQGTTSVSPNRWYHLVATFDGTTKRLFLNGSEIATAIVSSPLVYDIGVPFLIGEDTNSSQPAGIAFHGLIDEVSLYNRALNASEIQAIYNAGSAGKCKEGSDKPDTLITIPAEGSTACTSNVEFCFAGFSSRNPVAFTFKWRVDGGAWQDAIITDCVTLPDLSDGAHTFEVFAIDDLGNEDPTPAIRNFRVDTTKPVISDVQAAPTPLEATITWKTDEPATAQVEYGTSAAYGTTTPLDSTLKTNHSVKITGLTPNTTYHYRVRSKDACGHEAEWGDFTVTTTAVPDLQVPAAAAPPEVFTDRSFEVSWTVANRESGTANPVWVDKVFLSADAQLGGDTQLASFPFEQALEPGREAPRTQQVSIPRSAVPVDGDYYLIFLTDANNNVNEATFENNNFRAVPLRVRRTPLPDLLVDAIEAPDSALFGRTISVRWTVKNAGPAATDAAGWYDRVYLSTKQTIDADAVQLAETTNVSYLNAEESYVSSASVAIPRGIFGTYYLILLTDSRGNVSEGNESNNTRTRAIQIQVAPVPDLQVPLVQGSDEGFGGEPIVVSWRVENRQNGPTPPGQTSWTDNVFVSRDAAFNASAQLVGSFPHTGALAPGEGYDVRNQSVTLPRNASGDYYVYVVTDAGNQVYEYVFENNNVGRSQRVVHVQSTPPDLAVDSIDAPRTGEGGRNVTVRWVVKNQGAFAATGNWTDSVYLSTQPTLDRSKATLLGSVGHPGPLGAGLTYPASAEVRLPECSSGTYYLFVLTDSGNTVAEFDPNFDAEENNWTAATAQLSSRAPDLRVPLVVVPGSGVAGQAVPISWTVTNAGAGETLQTSWTDRVYLSKSATFDGSAVAVNNFSHSGALASGAGYSRTENIGIPISAEGTYYVFVWTDAANSVNECGAEDNNIGRGALVLDVQPPLPGPTGIPDLLPSGLTAPESAYATDVVTVTWTGSNQGTREAPASGWIDGVYLLSTNVFNPNAGFLGAVFIRGPLAVGASYPGSASVQIPRVSDGTYFLFVKADSGNNVAEGAREDNNTVSRAIQVTTPPVDLQVASVSVPEGGVSGQSLRVSWTVRNTGTVPTRTGNWTDAVYLSRDQVRDSTDPILGFVTHSGALAAGASYPQSLDVNIPAGLSGPYYVLVYTDRNDAVVETNENNNLGLASTALPIQLPALTDLAVTFVGTFSGGMPGGIVTIGWTVTNQGPNPTTGVWADAVYLSRDTTWDIEDIPIGRRVHPGPLAVGASYNGTLPVVLPSLDPGPYYVIVRTDILNAVRETDETNNIGVSGGTGAVDITELQLGVPYSSALGTGAEHYFKVFVPAGETLRIRLDGADGAANEMYVRYGVVPSRSAYHFFYSRPYEPDQEIVVPTTNAGWYYILVRGEFEPTDATPYAILAELVPFQITSVSPKRIGDNGQVTITLRGAKFENGSTVRLVNGGVTLTAAKVWALDGATIKARFFFTNAPHGTYNVVATSPSGTATSVGSTLTVESATKLLASLDIIGNLFPRAGRNIQAIGALGSLSNIDIPYADIIGTFSGKVKMGWSRPADSAPLQTRYPDEDWQYASPIASFDGSETTDTFWLRNIEPGQSVSFVFNIMSVPPGPFRSRIIYRLRTTAELVQQQQGFYEDLRQIYLTHPEYELQSELAPIASDSLLWWRYFEMLLIQDGFLEEPQSTPLRVISKGNSSLSQSNIGPLSVDVCEPECVRRVSIWLARCIGDVLAKPSLLGVYRGHLCRLEAASRIARCGTVECEELCREMGPGVWSLINGNRTGGACGDGQGTVARDPNDKIGPFGFGPQAFVSAGQPLPYTINFENVPTATAAAQRIRIIDQLDADLDWRTFRLKEIGFNNYRVIVPDNRSFFQTRMQLGPDLGNLLADITASVNIATGEARWTLTAIDPATGEPPLGANQGLLPPNDETHRGEGYVTFTVQPRAGLPTGTSISNQATITFDVEELIITNTVANTLDGQAPNSVVGPLPATSDSPFTVSWTATDDADGSGVQSFDIWVSDNDGPYAPFVSGTIEASAAFTGLPGHTYKFYSIARDNAGNVEAPPAQPDAVTTVTGTSVTNPVPQISEISPGSAAPGGPAFTLTVTGTGFVPGSTVRWNGEARPTVFLDSGQLTAQIPATDIAAEATAQVTVFSPEPGGGTSNAALFVIGSPQQPPAPLPQITGLSPDFAQAGGPAFTLTVSGSGFVSGSTVKWNDQARPTAFVSANQLTASIPAGDIAAPGTAQITVENPAPNAATSNTSAFRIDPAPADTTPPTSSVAALPATSDPAFLVTWSGQDELGGSGLKNYDIYVSDNNAAYTLWRSGATATSGTYTGAPEHTYRFYSRARDNAGNLEPVPSTPDAVTTVRPSPPTDTTPPTSTVAPLPAQTEETTFTVTWSGQDEAGGSGLKDFDIYVSDNNSAYTLWQSAVTATSASFTGQVGHTYRFYSIARDNNGNIEAAPATPDATITVAGVTENPVPQITGLNPASAAAGGPAFTLTINGNGFVDGSTVHWNGTARPTTFVSATQLTATIPVEDIASTGIAQVTVVSPGPGGGTSNALPFAIQDTTPPTSAVAPLPAQTNTMSFTVLWSGSDELGGSGLKDYDIYVSDNAGAYTLWQSAVTQTSATYIGVAGHTYRFYSIARDNAGNVEAVPAEPDAVTTVRAAPMNPAPLIAFINPQAAAAGGAAFTLTVQGTGFVNSSTVRWNGQPRQTTFVSDTQLTAALPASDIAAAGSAQVRVVNPAPGGGTSNAQVFLIGTPTLGLSVGLIRQGGEIVASITVANTGTAPAADVRVTSSTLDSTGTSSPLPAALGEISAGHSRAVTLRFAAPAPGTRTVLRVNGTFSGGTFGGSLRITVP